MSDSQAAAAPRASTPLVPLQGLEAPGSAPRPSIPPSAGQVTVPTSAPAQPTGLTLVSCESQRPRWPLLVLTPTMRPSRPPAAASGGPSAHGAAAGAATVAAAAGAAPHHRRGAPWPGVPAWAAPHGRLGGHAGSAAARRSGRARQLNAARDAGRAAACAEPSHAGAGGAAAPHSPRGAGGACGAPGVGRKGSRGHPQPGRARRGRECQREASVSTPRHRPIGPDGDDPRRGSGRRRSAGELLGVCSVPRDAPPRHASLT